MVPLHKYMQFILVVFICAGSDLVKDTQSKLNSHNWASRLQKTVLSDAGAISCLVPLDRGAADVMVQDFWENFKTFNFHNAYFADNVQRCSVQFQFSRMSSKWQKNYDSLLTFGGMYLCAWVWFYLPRFFNESEHFLQHWKYFFFQKVFPLL